MIPDNPLVDTNVFARAHDGRDPECRRALTVLEEHEVPLMIAAIVFAELARGGERYGGIERINRPPDGIIPAAFDFEAAKALARHFPSRVLKALGKKSEREAWDFDALIYATAIAWKADALITHDIDDFEVLRKAAEHADEIVVRLVHPREVVEVVEATPAPKVKAKRAPSPLPDPSLLSLFVLSESGDMIAANYSASPTDVREVGAVPDGAVKVDASHATDETKATGDAESMLETKTDASPAQSSTDTAALVDDGGANDPGTAGDGTASGAAPLAVDEAKTAPAPPTVVPVEAAPNGTADTSPET